MTREAFIEILARSPHARRRELNKPKGERAVVGVGGGGNWI